jgi:hypothetical protein
MATEIDATFEVTAWDEHQFDRRAGTAKLTRAKVTKCYSGGIEGESVTEWLMAYADDGTAHFVGLERIVGAVGDRDGTLVLQHVGAFEGGAATAYLVVVAGSCSGGFAGASGTGDFVADPAGRVHLDVTLS